jgi:hypothetical protein
MNKLGQINVNSFISALIVGIVFIPFIIIMDVLTYNVLTPNIGSTSYGSIILLLFGLIPLLMALFIIIGVIQFTQRPREQ